MTLPGMKMAVTGSAIPVPRHGQAEAGPIMGADRIRARAARHAVMARLVPDCRCCGKIGTGRVKKPEPASRFARPRHASAARLPSSAYRGHLGPAAPFGGVLFSALRWHAGALTRLRHPGNIILFYQVLSLQS